VNDSVQGLLAVDAAEIMSIIDSPEVVRIICDTQDYRLISTMSMHMIMCHRCDQPIVAETISWSESMCVLKI
jgi:hypothetical protein